MKTNIPKPTPIFRKIDNKTAVLATEYSCKKLEYTIDRSNMNPRSIAEKIDDKIMGDIASLELKKYLLENEVYATDYDEIRIDGFKSPDPGWDLVVGSAAKKWCSEIEDPTKPSNEVMTISVKSSRVPRGKSLDYCISNYDFKIFKKHDNISQDLSSKIEVQVYYPFEDSRLSDEHITKAQVLEASKKGYSEIVEKMNIMSRYKTPILTAFIDSENIIKTSAIISKKEDPYWNSIHQGYRKTMWKMPLRMGKDISKLPKRIKE